MRRLLLLALLLALAGCDTGSGPPPIPASIVVAAGADQTATVGSAVPVAPAVQVLNKKGRPMEGREVVFSLVSGGGTLTGNVAMTDEEGVARLGGWILGTTAGPQSIQARVLGLPAILISATGVAGDPATLAIEAGTGQTGVVGAPLTLKPSVRVRDLFGNPVFGVAVEFLVTKGGGSVSRNTAETDESGFADPGDWTLGTTPGANSLMATIGEVAPVTFTATGLPDAPSRVTVLVGDGQTGPVAEPLPLRPTLTVADRFGNLLGGIPVLFEVASGGGSIKGAEQLTDASGVAVSGPWTLGTGVGSQTLRISVSGTEPLILTAMALAGPPVTLAADAPISQAGTVATAVGTAPRVHVADAYGNPVSGATVLIVPSDSPDMITSPGTVEGGSILTDDGGFAEADAWILGTVAGVYKVKARVVGLEDDVTFKATAAPGPPAALSIHGGNGQATLAGGLLPIPIAVKVADAYGNGVEGVEVAFHVVEGDGVLTGTDPQTDETGMAALGTWTLGPIPGLNRLAVEAGGLPSLVFFAEGLTSGAFDMELEYLTIVDPSLLPAFQAAAARWEEVIVGDLADIHDPIPAGGCQPVPEAAGIDDVKVYVTVQAIDGVGGVLGRAGPCYYRTPGAPLAVTGTMTLDEADLADMLADGSLEDVIVHEIGHILGFGVLWNAGPNDFLVGRRSPDPFFQGAGAIAAFDSAGGEERTLPKVPVENTGGGGTRGSHWRESVHESELMTGWIEGGGAPNPLSAITIASLADMGYSVNMAAADPYTLFNPFAAAPRRISSPKRFIKELPPPTPMPLPGSGR